MKKKLVILGIVILIIVCGVIGFVLISKNNKASYIEKLETTRLEMLDGGSKAESLCNLTNKVWYNAIYEKYDNETDEYTKDWTGFIVSFDEVHSAEPSGLRCVSERTLCGA